jgi:hypothetical protein
VNLSISSPSMAVGLDYLPEAVRALNALHDADHADACTAEVSNARDKTPEQWIRAVLEETPIGGRARLFWRTLGVRLGPPNSPDHVQGWPIAARGNDWIRLETSTWFATLHALCYVDDASVTVALFVRHENPAGPLIWMPVSVIHHRGLPAMVQQAVRLTA